MRWDRATTKHFTAGQYQMDVTSVRSFRGTFVMLLEADGYLPAISRTLLPDEENVVIDFRLRKGQGPSGTVYLPNGEPAAGATVALSTTSYGVRIDHGRLKDDERWQSVTTDADGRFSFIPQTERYLVVVAHDEGYAEVTDEDFAAEPNIVLKPWGRVEGVLRVGGRALHRESLKFEYLRDYDQTLPPAARVSFHYDVGLTDANGCFASNRMVPGKVNLYHHFKLGGIMVTRTRSQILEVLPGQTTYVTIGGTGRAVTGKFVAVPYEPIAWHKGQVSIDLKLPEPARPNDYNEMIFVERREWGGNWQRHTEEGRLYEKMERTQRGRSYRAKIEPDGTFRVDDVPPGEYEVRACLGSDIGGKATWGPRKPVPVPDCEFVVSDVNETDANEPLDLGVIKVWQDKRPRIGDRAAVFEAITFEGERTNLLAFRGKVVLLTFWRSEPSILSELDYAMQLAGDYKANERFVAIGMSLDRDIEAAKKFAKDNKLKWINCFPLPGTRSEISYDYEIWKFPMTFLIDQFGEIRAIDPTPLRFKPIVDKALAIK
jgi:peroxiredoxin